MPNCKKCNQNIPARVHSDKGWEVTSSHRKYCFDCSPKGSHNTRKLDVDAAPCSICGKPLGRHGATGMCGSCKVTAWRRRTKFKAIHYKGGSCVACGFDKYQAAMEFHHLDPSEKDFSFAGMTISWERMKKELDKCILLCANCHAAVHSKELDAGGRSDI